MPGFVIHLASANEYIRKHPNDIQDKKNFIHGNIAPDLTTKEGKKITHYGKSSSEVLLRNYLEKNEINNDYNKGYFLHLVTDYIFYNKLLRYTSKEIYDDYDILNNYLMKKYGVELPKEIENKVFFKKGNTKILSKELAEQTIEISSEIPVEEIKNQIFRKKYEEKWEKFRKLIRLD